MADAQDRAKSWYVVQAQSGFEAKAASGLAETIRNHGLEADLGEIILPMENVVEVKKGAPTERARKFYPGYLFVELHMSDAMWHAVKATPRVIGFIGNARKPQPIPSSQVDQIRSQMEEGLKAPKAVLTFQSGDPVKVIDGPFKNFNGTVEEVNADKSKVRVLVSIFGRATPVELDFVQVEPLPS